MRHDKAVVAVPAVENRLRDVRTVLCSGQGRFGFLDRLHVGAVDAAEIGHVQLRQFLQPMDLAQVIVA